MTKYCDNQVETQSLDWQLAQILILSEDRHSHLTSDNRSSPLLCYSSIQVRLIKLQLSTLTSGLGAQA